MAAFPADFPPYEGAVKAGVLSMMCGNNLVNGQYVCQNNMSMNTQLKSWAGFKG
jgi:beta-glucosidase-like glycosyl hydrolase